MGLVFDPVEPTPQPQGGITFDPIQSNVPGQAVPVRAAKADFVLGSTSPGLGNLSAELQTSGDRGINDLVVRKQQADYEAQKANVVSNLINTQQGPVTPELASFVSNLSQQGFADFQSNDPMSKAYAQKIVSTSIANTPKMFTQAETAHPEPPKGARMEEGDRAVELCRAVEQGGG